MGLPTSDRFSDRVADYVRYRPDYPAAAIDLVRERMQLGPGREVADLGAGTGILTGQLAATKATVHAVDPNEEMLAAARELLADIGNATFAVGTAEETTLADAAVDGLVAGQAFHWFDHPRARTEALRILRPGGMAALLWNTKDFESSTFLARYEELLERFAPEFTQVRHEGVGDAVIEQYFGATPEVYTFPHAQRFNWKGVVGRVMSASYAPRPGQPGHDALLSGLRNIFEWHAVGGEIDWPYVTQVYIGPVTPD